MAVGNTAAYMHRRTQMDLLRQKRTIRIGRIGILNVQLRLLPVQQRVARESIPCGKDRRTRIVKAQLGNRAGLIGAALLGENKRGWRGI